METENCIKISMAVILERISTCDMWWKSSPDENLLCQNVGQYGLIWTITYNFSLMEIKETRICLDSGQIWKLIVKIVKISNDFQIIEQQWKIRTKKENKLW